MNMDKTRMNEMIDTLWDIERDMGGHMESVAYNTRAAIEFGFNPQSGWWDDVLDAVLAYVNFVDYPDQDEDFQFFYAENTSNFDDLLDRYYSGIVTAVENYENKVK